MWIGGLAVTVALLVAGPTLAQYPSGQGQSQIPSGEISNIPTQAPDCLYRHACINWGQCYDGTINTGGVGVLNVRTPKPVPAGYSGDVCDGIGNVCCYIPDELWVDPGQPTDPIIEVGGGTITQNTWNNTCATVHHICVPHYQCTSTGDINTSGVGLINPRFRPKSQCTNPDKRYTGVAGTCCKLPSPQPLLDCPAPLTCNLDTECDGPILTDKTSGFYTSCYLDTWTALEGVCCKEPEPEPLYLCPGDQVCVSNHLCTDQGNVNTDGSGIFNTIINLPCYLDAALNSRGVCCNPPPQEPVAVCPGQGTHSCVQEGLCQTSTLIDTNGKPLACYLNDGSSTGLCCESVDPVQFCSNDGSHFCAETGSCLGEIPVDAYGGPKACYLGNTGSTGHCCPTPLPVDSCASDGSYFCAASGNCLDQTYLLDPYGAPTTCYVGGQSSVGECCQTPLPVTSCGTSNEYCAAPNQCIGTTLNNLYNDGLACVYNSTYSGICCAPPVPLQTCEAGYSCLYQQECEGQPEVTALFPDCYVTNTDVGKCCQPKVVAPVIIDTCSGDSVCLPEILCPGGDILNAQNIFESSKTSVGPWARCRLSGSGLLNPGVCCKNAAIPTEESVGPTATQCGVRNYGLDARIQNNDPVNYQAQFGEFPWQAIIFFTNFTFKCGASLISDRWLLTGAHCVAGYEPSDLRVRLGEWKVDSYDEPGKYLDIFIKRIFYHNEFSSGNLFNDIALIQLETPIYFQYHINAVCLPETGQVFYGQTRCFVSGWGKNAFDGGQYQVIMKKVDLPLVGKKECQNKLSKTILGRFFRLHPSFMCAGGEKGKDACEGDGGGPLVCQDPNTGRYVISGITAWGIGCGTQDVPGVFVDVQYFRTWIDKIINDVQVLEASQVPVEQQTGYSK